MTQLLENAVCGTAMILAVALVRRVLKERLAPEARLALWAVCLFRLLTPAAPASALSLWGLFAQPAPQPAPMPQLYIPAPVAAPAPQPGGPGFPWEMAAGAVWLAVGLALAVRYLLSWRRTRRAVACAIPLDRGDGRYEPLPKCARLREGPMEGAPLTFGVVRPTVVLFPGLEGAELDCVLAHEGVHARRRDNLWHYVMAAALAVFWWDPAVWLMSRLLRRDIELSCDRAAVKKLGADRRGDYARALVSLATQDSGPAFCQTFGRKAAEERIRSIMKFKKTSVIGAIFSLALVLAVTVAFASEPKTDVGTVQFHGQTFSRSELSQGTLDWLDWYLALPEEEQLAVSYVPAELRKDRDVSTQDAYSSEKTGQTVMVSLPDKTREIQSGFPEVDPDDVDLSEMKKMLAKKVAGGEIAQAEADQRLADTEAMLEQARRGELKLFLYDSGDGENWVYGAGVFQVNGEVQFRFVDPGQMMQPLYWEKAGELVPVDPDMVANGYVLTKSGPDQPTYVEEGEDISEKLGRLLGEADIKYDEGKTITDYNVKLPTFDEDGNPVNDSVTGSKFYDYKVVTDDAVSGGVRTSSGTYALCADKSCDVSYDHCHIDGKVVRVYQEDPGLLCAHPDCTNGGPHEHDGVQYAGKAGTYTILDPEAGPVPSAAPVASGQHHQNHHGNGHH